jgi:hypothetical protein
MKIYLLGIFEIRLMLLVSATFFPVNKNDEYFNMSASLSDPHRKQKLSFFATAELSINKKRT